MPNNMKSIKHFLLLVVMVLPFTLIAQSKIKKSDLKILIVAHNPDSLQTNGYGSPVSPRYAELAKTRGQEYKKLLSPHFKIVKLINSEEYHYTMSDDFDVTVMDDLPKPIEKVDLGLYRSGKSIVRGDQVMTYNRYLPNDFDRAIIMTGLITDDMTYIASSKYITQCHCLNAHAFNIKTEHDIFNTPFKVNLPYEKNPTPKPLRKYYSGIDFPDQIDMWRVQIESPEDGNGYMIGQIMVGMDFDDSPDCEYISGGHSIKDITGMSIGRSGNIFHWGFSASPDFMTESAKKVFINTVFYMAQFNGKKPLVKILKGESRKWVDEFCYRKTGQLIDHKNKTYPTPKSATDTLVKFYTENYDYFYNPSGLDFIVDEDVKSLGIANHDVQLLEKSIALLEADKDTDKALRILTRYTEYDFNSAAKWRTWLNTFKDYLFFTELGGYKFMIDTWNHPELEASLGKFVTQTSGTTKPAGNNIVDELKANIEVKQDGQNSYTLQIAVTIDEGWHAYAKLTPETNYFIPTKIEFVMPDGSQLIGEVSTPKTYPYDDLKDVEVYKGDFVFKQKFTIDQSFTKNDDLKVMINYQLCNDYLCKMPTTKEFSVSL